jgi:pimeloyl-ACP methyl ester carboxylesterase
VTIAFIHGGLHNGRCWAETVDALHARRPDLAAISVDLPGRSDGPGDLASLTIDDCVHSVTKQIVERTDGESIVLVGHSLAGVVLSGVVQGLGAERVAQVIFVACCVPPTGASVLDTLPPVMKPVVGRFARNSPVLYKFPPGWTRHFFGNRATRAQRARIKAGLVPESSALITEVVTASWPRSIRKSWVLTQRDRALPAGKQRGFIRNVGGVDRLVTIDAGHEVMVTYPTELANAIVGLAG